MRGKALDASDVVLNRRITPAYAGKSFWGTAGYKPIRDHPRLCGEKPFLQDIFPPVPGSPPPMRGKVRMYKGNLAMDRITPAYAGKRSFPHGLVLASRDHPRLCGEKIRTRPKISWIPGSPPPMRGKALELNGASELIGITPAYAGKRLPQENLLKI